MTTTATGHLDSTTRSATGGQGSVTPTAPAAGPGRRRRWPRRLALGTLATLCAAVLGILAFVVVVGPIYTIPSGSMEPTLRPGDIVYVDKVGFHASSLQRGDVVVFRNPAYVAIPSSGPLANNPLYVRYRQEFTHADKVLIKRVIGLPGQTITVTHHAVLIDGKALREPYVHTTSEGKTFGPYVVPAHSYFVMGDNRTHSIDSRFFPGHAVPARLILGRAMAVIWPPSQTRSLAP